MYGRVFTLLMYGHGKYLLNPYDGRDQLSGHAAICAATTAAQDELTASRPWYGEAHPRPAYHAPHQPCDPPHFNRPYPSTGRYISHGGQCELSHARGCRVSDSGKHDVLHPRRLHSGPLHVAVVSQPQPLVPAGHQLDAQHAKNRPEPGEEAEYRCCQVRRSTHSLYSGQAHLPPSAIRDILTVQPFSNFCRSRPESSRTILVYRRASRSIVRRRRSVQRTDDSRCARVGVCVYNSCIMLAYIRLRTSRQSVLQAWTARIHGQPDA